MNIATNTQKHNKKKCTQNFEYCWHTKNSFMIVRNIDNHK